MSSNHKQNTSFTKNELKNIISKQDRENEKLRERIRQLEALLDIYRRASKGDYLMKTIILPDGYNGHTEKFALPPVEVDKTSVKLQCASEGKEHMFRWINKDELKKMQDDQSKAS